MSVSVKNNTKFGYVNWTPHQYNYTLACYDNYKKNLLSLSSAEKHRN